MQNTDVYNNIHTSLLKYCKDFIHKHNLENVENFDFDAHGSIGDLPDVDLIGIGEYSLSDDQGIYYTTCSIVVCTAGDDANLKRLRPIVGKIFNELKPGYTDLKVVDSIEGKVKGNLVVIEGVEVMPVARTTTRPLVMINVMFGSTFLAPP